MPTNSPSRQLRRRVSKKKEAERFQTRLNTLYHEVKIILSALSQASAHSNIEKAHLLDESVQLKDFEMLEDEDVEKVSEILGFKVNLEDSVLDVAERIRSFLLH